MNLEEAISKSKIIIKKGRYAYVQTDTVNNIDKHFMITKDDDEITIITEEDNMNTLKVDGFVGYYKLIEIQAALPFLVVGFLAKVSEVIAKKGLNILIVSTFSKDYILLKEETHKVGIEELKKLGFPISFE